MESDPANEQAWAACADVARQMAQMLHGMMPDGSDPSRNDVIPANVWR